MGISKYSSEGYFDPTPYLAIQNIEYEAKRKAAKDAKRKSYRPLVFICSPYSGNTKNNVRNARRYSRYALEKGCIPFAPHLLFPQFLNDSLEEERKLGIAFGLVFQSKCDEVWVFGNNHSSGMKKEILKAKERNIPIRYISKETVDKWLGGSDHDNKHD